MTAGSGGPTPAEEHRAFDELAVGWALHALEPEDEAAFAQHLLGCDRCARTVAETSEVMAALAADLPPAEPSDQLRERLRSAVSTTEQRAADDGAAVPGARSEAATGFPHYRPVEPRVAGGSPGRRRAPLLVLAAAAVAAVLGLGVWNVVLADSRSDLQRTLAEQERIVETLLTPGEATVAALSTDDGRAVATVVARPDRVEVVSYGLPVNAGDQTYVVWGVDGDQLEALGTFDVTGSQMTVQTVGSGSTGLDGYSGYGISIEPGQQAPSAPTEIVATG